LAPYNHSVSDVKPCIEPWLSPLKLCLYHLQTPIRDRDQCLGHDDAETKKVVVEVVGYEIELACPRFRDVRVAVLWAPISISVL
jgi:hypothetical protein